MKEAASLVVARARALVRDSRQLETPTA